MCLWVLAGPASARLLGHRAVYDLKLLSAKDGADVTAVDGRMALELADACEGFTLNQWIILRIYDTRGGAVTSDFRMSSWEALDGRSFRFNTREEVNGREMQAFDGQAVLDPDAAGGQVVLTGGEGAERTLKAETIFPTQHTRALIKRARRGEKLLIVDVFDGSKGLGSLFGTSAFIGGPIDAGTYDGDYDGADLLKAAPSWPVQVAYFGYPDGGEKRSELPEFEIGYRIFDNGIVSDLQVDYGDFEVSGSLSNLEALPEPGC
jgi:hypothetical protein